MILKKRMKEVLAYSLTLAITISGISGVGVLSKTTKADEGAKTIAVTETKEITAFEKEWDTTGGDNGYKYMGYVGCDVGAGSKYMELTYKGDAEAFAGIRLEFHDSSDAKIVTSWVTENEEGTLKTVEGTTLPQATEEEQTVTIDLAASGVDTTNGISAFHLHANAEMGTFTIVNAQIISEKAVEVTQEKEITAFEKEWDTTGGDNGYKYMGYVGCDASAAFKYMELTYKGDAEAFAGIRLEFHDSSDAKIVTSWVTENEEGTLKTVEGTTLPQATEEEQTVIIDLAASGVDTTNGISAFHVHADAEKGAFTITSAKMLSIESEEQDETTEEPTTKENKDTGDTIYLDGDANGRSAITGSWSLPASTSTDADGNIKETYKHLGYVTFKDYANDSFKYLKITYVGDISMLRFEFVANAGTEDEEMQGPFWFDPEQATHFVTEDGSEIVLKADTETTVVIDLEKSGVDMSKYNSGFHMHYGSVENDMQLQILSGELYGGTMSEPQPEAPTTAPVTVAPTTTPAPTTVAPTTKVTVGKIKVKSATKKKAAKKASIKLKAIKGAKGYQVKVSTSKKFGKKVTRTVLTKKVKVVVKKLKVNKQYYVKARAYKKVNGKKVYGKWSKIVKVKNK